MAGRKKAEKAHSAICGVTLSKKACEDGSGSFAGERSRSGYGAGLGSGGLRRRATAYVKPFAKRVASRGGAQRAPRGAAERRTKLEIRTLNGQIREQVELPVPVRGRWITDQRYADLRNAAWFVRNFRMVGHDDNIAIAKLCYAVWVLFENGEPVESVVPSLVDLFLRS